MGFPVRIRNAQQGERYSLSGIGDYPWLRELQVEYWNRGSIQGIEECTEMESVTIKMQRIARIDLTFPGSLALSRSSRSLWDLTFPGSLALSQSSRSLQDLTFPGSLALSRSSRSLQDLRCCKVRIEKRSTHVFANLDRPAVDHPSG